MEDKELNIKEIIVGSREGMCETYEALCRDDLSEEGFREIARLMCWQFADLLSLLLQYLYLNTEAPESELSTWKITRNSALTRKASSYGWSLILALLTSIRSGLKSALNGANKSA
jgi:hypothetical protein